MTVPPTVSPRRVLTGQALVKLTLFAAYAAMVSIILPSRVAELDPDGKVASLAAITTAGFIVNAIAQPTIGALSDRTRTRFGRRLPWMVAGAAVGGLALGLTGDATTLLLLAALWMLVQLGLHGLEVSMDAYLVDAFPPSRRGIAAGVVGLALVAGTSAGALLAGSAADRPSAVTWALAAAIAVAVVLFAALVHDGPAPPGPRSLNRPTEALRAIISTLAAHPDFLKVLLWRVGYAIAYGAVFSFLLYIVTDLIGVPTLEAARVVGLLTVVAGVGSAISVLVGGWLSDRLRRRRVFLLVGSATLVAGDILLLLWPTVSVAIAAAALFGIGLGLAIACGRALASQVLPNPERGAAAGLGTLNTAANIGQAAAPAIGAFAIGVGGYPAAFVVSIIGALLSSVAVAFVRTIR
jgi:MFS family permease